MSNKFALLSKLASITGSQEQTGNISWEGSRRGHALMFYPPTPTPSVGHEAIRQQFGYVYFSDRWRNVWDQSTFNLKYFQIVSIKDYGPT